MIGVCTDSNAQLPDALVAMFGIEVVPLTVTVDDVDYAEGVDLGADDFWAAFATPARPSMSTAAPSPRRFLEAWRLLVGRGAREIVSVHMGSEVSGTLNSARLAAGDAPVPVTLVDTHTASFAVALAAWAAAEVARDGGSARDAAAAAERRAGECGNVFVVGSLDAARAGGRLATGAVPAATTPVLSLEAGLIKRVAAGGDADGAVEAMAAHILEHSRHLRVGIGRSDASSFAIADKLRERLSSEKSTIELVDYRVGPSVGAHTGPGTAGAVFHALVPQP